ncbi:glycosyltransferase family 1 protein [Sphingosinicella sp. BN140058]|uniref:glycosyltransferase family 4 protein n=1 Tax=Sphingosinicella sp. BN140058 TaxID=1892855 RepID=UPI0010130059|nr:glycosyltransferase family 1 protein [Sphingosinicella sp. BN140058]QAY76537.1 glycosyltransferase family 1 protein [Sphingosinicella sp. BN140058]
MRILIVTDAWAPQVNGVVRTLQATRDALQQMGHVVGLIAPDLFRSLPCPTYPEIRLALAGAAAIGRRIEAFAPEAIHIATEGPLGLAARRWCLRRGHPFTTAYHTQFPDYLARRTRLPAAAFWPFIRRFHRPAAAILVSTRAVAVQLDRQGLGQTRLWSRGVDLSCFGPDAPVHPRLQRLPGPILLHVGRLAVEKNVEAFLRARHAGSKIVVGDGPLLAALKCKYPDVAFLGARQGAELASLYASADALVFPSRTDTFGLGMIEALACGTPIAAFPVPGPADVLDESVGAMREDLDDAIAAALTRDRAACAAFGRRFSWSASAGQFVSALVPLKAGADFRPGLAATA